MRKQFSKAMAVAFALTLFGQNRVALAAATITVNTTLDDFGTANPGCTLREAIQSANLNANFGGCIANGSYGTDLINLPAGFYTLTIVGTDEDNNATGDLDIRSNLTISGAGAGTTAIGQFSTINDRVMHVVQSGAIASVNDVTIRDGNLLNGRSGAGLRSEPFTNVTLNRVTVGLNSADGNAGGILNRAVMRINDSVVDSNITLNASQGGGGIFNDDDASLVVNNSRIINNTTTGDEANGSGAGIYNDALASLELNNTSVDGNIIDLGGVVFNQDKGNGGGIYSEGTFSIVDSTISNNVANGNNAHGGGISCETAPTASSIIVRSVIFGNHAENNPSVGQDSPIGGGVFNNCSSLTILTSVISSNFSAGRGGGVGSFNTLKIKDSTIANNSADDSGGGLFFQSNGSTDERLAVIDASILNNASGANGGGVAIEGEQGSALLLGATIAGNSSDDNGGGLITQALATTAGNTVIAGNIANGSAIHDDCEGSIESFGHNLVQSAAGCTFNAIGGSSDLTNINAMLAPPTNNGGPIVGASNGTMAGMLTRSPLPNSPLVDADSGTCNDDNGDLIPNDQIGRPRNLDGPDPDTNSNCDIGAIEFQLAPELVFANSFE